MIRLYISSRIGAGIMFDPYRSKIHNFVDVSTGEWFDEYRHSARDISICFVEAEAATHTDINNDPDIYRISELYDDVDDFRDGLSRQMSTIPVGIRTEMETRFEAIGVNTGWIVGTNTVRDVLRYLLRQFTLSQWFKGKKDNELLDFLRDNVDSEISNIPQIVRQRVSDWMDSKGLDTGWIAGTNTIREVIHYILNNLSFRPLKFFKRREEF